VYQRNYLSGSFMEIFICEIASRFFFWKKDRENRNFRHQKDEALGFAAGLRRGFFPKTLKQTAIEDRLRLWDRGDRDSLRVDGFKVRNYPFMEYLSYWYDKGGEPKPGLPLYFPISTNIQTGKAGLSSPVLMDSLIFTDAIDILDKTRQSDCDRPDRTLSLVGATNLSQLFPAMNAFTHIPRCGNFIDGGTYENMGLHLLQQIYFWLDKKRCEDPRMKKVKIRMIYLVNNGLETAKPEMLKPVSQVLSPFKHAGGSSINGRTTYFTKRVAYDLHPSDTLHRFWLQGPKGAPTHLKIPLGRWLSNRSVMRTDARADALLPEIRASIAPLLQR
jgi:hypothetical protein